MRKITLLFVCLFTIMGSTALADSNKIIRFDQLPQAAQEFVEEHFADNEIAITSLERELFERNYELIFVDGKKLEFDRNGGWKDVDCPYDQVPESIVPEFINNFVTEHFPSAKIIHLGRDKASSYEVDLSNNFELGFDQNFKLISMRN